METGSSHDSLNLDRIRALLTRLEDTIIFCLIERSRFPSNSLAYDSGSNFSIAIPGSPSQSLVRYVIEATEATQALAGRYEKPEEQPIFLKELPTPLVHSNYTQVLHPAGASININQNISDLYFNQMLPLFTSVGDDGNYASTAAADLACLQALSLRIHYGKFVAESKFKAAPGLYDIPIRGKDEKKLMELLTSVKQEETVKKRVMEKAATIAQDVKVDDASNGTTTNDNCTAINNKNTTYKVDPKAVGIIYEQWVIPLTKEVEVKYLLSRLD